MQLFLDYLINKPGSICLKLIVLTEKFSSLQKMFDKLNASFLNVRIYVFIHDPKMFEQCSILHISVNKSTIALKAICKSFKANKVVGRYMTYMIYSV